MGENLNLMQALYITVSSMLMVFLILLLICGVLSVFKSIFKSETVEKTNGITHSKSKIVENNLEVDEEGCWHEDEYAQICYYDKIDEDCENPLYKKYWKLIATSEPLKFGGQ